MNFFKIKLNANKNRIFIYPLSDIHIGNYYREDKLKEAIKFIKKKDVYTILLGDYIDGINIYDKRFDLKRLPNDYITGWMDNIYLEQLDKFIELLKPIKNKILWIHEGNHERTLRIKHSIDPIKIIADSLGIKYLCYEDALVCLNINNKIVKIFSTHGHLKLTGGRNKLSRLRKFIEQTSHICADIYIKGHLHEGISARQSVITINKKGKKVIKNRLYMIANAFMHTIPENKNSYSSLALYTETIFSHKILEINLKNGIIVKEFESEVL